VVDPLVEGALEVLLGADLQCAQSGPEDCGVDGGLGVDVALGVGDGGERPEGEHGRGASQ